MNEKDFVGLCKKTVAEYVNSELDKTDGKQITEDDVFIGVDKENCPLWGENKTKER